METRRVKRRNGEKCLTTGGWWHRMWECNVEGAVASLLSSNCRRHCEDRTSKASALTGNILDQNATLQNKGRISLLPVLCDFSVATPDAPALVCAFRSVTLIGARCSLLQDGQYHHTAKMVAFNWKALENFPLLMYILAAKTLILCLAFAGVKMYQSKKIEEKLKREREEKLKTEAEKKDD
ncbi:small integral membrane protein 11A isoform X2 [Aquila chrysaetos chrysaetos]|uniref:small integral membrane protein 11A isoform X2 n=1 Tax=Aquila chrysaetos chrysaetos TaxID=223781 RepID=UPI0011772F99|nr:small integral membrane protein 11A isoform X2 [Aquila chrysaetos chrysaetos]